MGSVSQIALTEKGKSVSDALPRKSKVRKYLPMYLSVAPYFIIFLAFGIAPSIFSLYLAFQKWDGIGAMEFVGWNNFIYVLTDPIFGQSIVNTFLIWIMSTIPMLFFALVMAFLLNLRSRSKFLYQVCYFLPYVTSTVAISLVFGSFFGEQFGLINTTLNAIGLSSINWLTDPWPIKWAIAMIVIWRWTGYNALIYMAGLQSISVEFYEAARLDGANTRDIFFNITIPLLRPVILFTIVTSSIGGLSLFAEPQILLSSGGQIGLANAGGVGHEGLTMALYQYWQSFPSFRFGYGAAVSWVMFFIIIAFTFMNWKLTERTER